MRSSFASSPRRALSIASRSIASRSVYSTRPSPISTASNFLQRAVRGFRVALGGRNAVLVKKLASEFRVAAAGCAEPGGSADAAAVAVRVAEDRGAHDVREDVLRQEERNASVEAVDVGEAAAEH